MRHIHAGVWFALAVVAVMVVVQGVVRANAAKHPDNPKWQAAVTVL